jgi:hypothetical protein
VVIRSELESLLGMVISYFCELCAPGGGVHSGWMERGWMETEFDGTGMDGKGMGGKV